VIVVRLAWSLVRDGREGSYVSSGAGTWFDAHDRSARVAAVVRLRGTIVPA
jgi:hypothetical protein